MPGSDSVAFGFGLTDEDMKLFQALVMVNPRKPPVIPGTGGLRKMRCGRHDTGKRSAFRVCYVYFEEFGTIILVLIYSKNEADNLSDAQKQEIKTLIERIQNSLSSKPYRAG